MPTTTFLTLNTPSVSVDKSVHNLYYQNIDTIFTPPPDTVAIEQVLDTTSSYFNPYTKNLQIGDEFIYTCNGDYYTATQSNTSSGYLVFSFYKNGVKTFEHIFYLNHTQMNTPSKYNVHIHQIVKQSNLVTSNATINIFTISGSVQVTNSVIRYEESVIDTTTPGVFGIHDTLNVEFRNTSTTESPYFSLKNLKIKIFPFN